MNENCDLQNNNNRQENAILNTKFSFFFFLYCFSEMLEILFYLYKKKKFSKKYAGKK